MPKWVSRPVSSNWPCQSGRTSQRCNGRRPLLKCTAMNISNRSGQAGFYLSLGAVAGLLLVGHNDAGAILAFLAIPALIFSVFGLKSPSRRLAGWGLGLSLFTCLYLPTIAVFAIKAWN